jgi:hypothetical protein
VLGRDSLGSGNGAAADRGGMRVCVEYFTIGHPPKIPTRNHDCGIAVREYHLPDHEMGYNELLLRDLAIHLREQ